MTDTRSYNFSAGPAALPLPVLKKAQEEFLCLPGVGASVMEISHRSKTFESIINAAEANVRSLLNVPDNYQVLFLQGGALLQFGMIPMNLLGKKRANYVVTGTWSKKAASEALIVLENDRRRITIAWDGKDCSYKKKPSDGAISINSDPHAAYTYICSNETIEGVQYQDYPYTADLPLICDASSDIFSKPINIKRFGLIFACAQKNVGPAGVTLVIIRDDLLDRSPDHLPSLLHYKKIAEQKSMLNTPPCFAIYMVKLVTEWLMNDMGGLEKVHAFNKEKAALLYDTIDRSGDYYVGHAEKGYRSLMNVPFRLPSEELDKKFEVEAQSSGLIMLSGHRSVGGLRASIYNAMPREGVVTLCDFMREFAKKNG